MTDILDRLRDLHTQATTERSHFYVAKSCLDAITEIEMLRGILADIATASNAKNHRIEVLERLVRDLSSGGNGNHKPAN